MKSFIGIALAVLITVLHNVVLGHMGIEALSVPRVLSYAGLLVVVFAVFLIFDKKAYYESPKVAKKIESMNIKRTAAGKPELTAEETRKGIRNGHIIISTISAIAFVAAATATYALLNWIWAH